MGNKTSTSASTPVASRHASSSSRSNNNSDDDIFISTEEEDVDDLPEECETDQEKLSYWQMAKQGYQQLVNAIIRPPRCAYTTEHLGPKTFEFGGKYFERKDFELPNARGNIFLIKLFHQRGLMLLFLRNDSYVFNMGSCGTAGKALALCHLYAWQQLGTARGPPSADHCTFSGGYPSLF